MDPSDRAPARFRARRLAGHRAARSRDARARPCTTPSPICMARLLPEPTLIHIEDSHWLDAASCELLHAVFAGVGERPWAVLITRRDVAGGLDLADHPNVTTLRLTPLSAAAAASLRVGDRAGRGAAARGHRRTRRPQWRQSAVPAGAARTRHGAVTSTSYPTRSRPSSPRASTRCPALIVRSSVTPQCSEATFQIDVLAAMVDQPTGGSGRQRPATRPLPHRRDAPASCGSATSFSATSPTKASPFGRVVRCTTERA